MNTATTNKRLRPRKKVTIPTKGITTFTKPRTGNTIIASMEVTIEYNGIIRIHPLDFSGENLSLKEMYNTGFVGELDLPEPDGSNREAEVEAGPIGQFPGEILGRFVFRVYDARTKAMIKAKIIKFSFKKAP